MQPLPALEYSQRKIPVKGARDPQLALLGEKRMI